MILREITQTEKDSVTCFLSYADSQPKKSPDCKNKDCLSKRFRGRMKEKCHWEEIIILVIYTGI
jgi:hypothetical protein